MDVTAISLGIVVAGVVVAYLAQPWRAKTAQSERTNPEGLDKKTLGERHEALLSALRDLDFDHEVGKVTEADYNSLRQTLLAEAALVLTKLDGIRAAEAHLEAQIEAQILAVRRTLRTDQRPGEGSQAPLPGNTCGTCGRPAHPGDLYCAGCGTRLNAACPDCGAKVQATDRFCARCGIELALAT